MRKAGTQEPLYPIFLGSFFLIQNLYEKALSVVSASSV
jgi:hypothetical protein